jgi:hypothetical protein
VWLQLEEKRIPYTIEKINMRCYGDKPSSFLAKVGSEALEVWSMAAGGQACHRRLAASHGPHGRCSISSLRWWHLQFTTYTCAHCGSHAAQHQIVVRCPNPAAPLRACR